MTRFIPNNRLTSSLYSPLVACLGLVKGAARAWADDEAAVDMSEDRGWKGTAVSAGVAPDDGAGRRERMSGMTRKRGSTG